jgi:pimeloyl-ACP methyl ester carboxylesterase
MKMPSMPIARANGIDLDYDTFGVPANPPLLLIMGFSVQKIAWDEDFCNALADRGFFVIRFDNRDVGLSTKIESGPAPDLGAAFTGDTSSASYRLADMAADAAGLLDALELPAAHVVGASMGGMIAQEMAIHHPDRVLSLCSIMSTTGDTSVGQPSREAMSALLSPPPRSREEAVAQSVAISAVIGSTGFDRDEDRIRDRAGRAWDRNHESLGVARQLIAILASPDRTASLAGVTSPTVVIHGADDPLIDQSGGRATAAAVPGAELVIIPGMGHDLPLGVWPQVIEAIVANAGRAAAETAKTAN